VSRPTKLSTPGSGFYVFAAGCAIAKIGFAPALCGAIRCPYPQSPFTSESAKRRRRARGVPFWGMAIALIAAVGDHWISLREKRCAVAPFKHVRWRKSHVCISYARTRQLRRNCVETIPLAIGMCLDNRPEVWKAKRSRSCCGMTGCRCEKRPPRSQYQGPHLVPRQSIFGVISERIPLSLSPERQQPFREAKWLRSRGPSGNYGKPGEPKETSRHSHSAAVGLTPSVSLQFTSNVQCGPLFARARQPVFHSVPCNPPSPAPPPGMCTLRFIAIKSGGFEPSRWGGGIAACTAEHGVLRDQQIGLD